MAKDIVIGVLLFICFAMVYRIIYPPLQDGCKNEKAIYQEIVDCLESAIDGSICIEEVRAKLYE